MLTGAVLQFLCGEVDNTHLTYPWSAVLFLNYVGLLVVLISKCENRKFFHTFFGESTGIAVIASMLVLILIMGITGKNISHSWPFVLLMFWLMSLVGIVAIRDVCHFRKVPKSALLYHVALFMVLAAAMFGNADKQRIIVRADIDKEIAEGMNSKGELRYLPFSIQLKAFHFEEYAPKICLLNDSNGINEKLVIAVNEKGKQYDCAGWRISVRQYIDEAIPMDNGNNLDFQEMHHVGASHAAFVEAIKGNNHVEGWICTESFLFESINLHLDNHLAIAFKPVSPKGYVSDLLLTDVKGNKKTTKTSVNHPASLGSWLIYQKGYDVGKGKWSDYSVLECVHDGWSWVTCVALWLMVMAAIVAIVEARRKSGKKK